MIRRPKPNENEEDILRMQEEFLTNKNSQPSAQVINLRKEDHQTTKRPCPIPSQSHTPSKYAKSKGLTKEKRYQIKNATGSLLDRVSEKNLKSNAKPDSKDDNVYNPKVLPAVLGDIVEKNYDGHFNLDFKPMPSKGFPVVSKHNTLLETSYKRLITHPIDEIIMEQDEKLDTDQPSNSKLQVKKESKTLNIPPQSYILTNKEAGAIHSENVAILLNMDETEILKEKQKLLSSLDSRLIDFIRDKKNQSNISKNINIDSKEVIRQTKGTSKVDSLNEQNSNTENINDILWENDVLSHPLVNKWLHCDNFEKEKLEWLKDIENRKDVKSDEPYEARFDFKGYLLPYTLEYTEQTKALFHHGEEPHRPGYSIIELMELTRSTVMQQRVIALNTIAGILEYYMAGIYKDVIEIPLSKLFFVIRFAIDENKVVILEPALKAMRNLFFNKIDEACLDALLGFEEGTFQPCFENNKSEIEDIESEESEIKDFHLAEIDLIAAVLRTDILQRIHYILDSVKPSFNCVHYLLQILTRLCRNSPDLAKKIVEVEHLISIIVKSFVPTMSINLTFDISKCFYRKPIAAALKLIRILSAQSREIGDILIKKYGILLPISAYISSEVDDTYGLKLQIESFCILSNLLNYGLATENVMSLCPLIITTLYKHVQVTDIFINSSILSATHAAVILQLVNKLLNCNIPNVDNFKQQVYPLLYEGVQKWSVQTAYADSYTCGHMRLLSAALDCCRSIIITENVQLKYLTDALRILCSSKGFELIVNNIVPSSNLLSDIADTDIQVTKNIVSLGGCIVDSTHKVIPVLNITSPIPFLTSLFRLLCTINDKYISNLLINKILNYLQKISKKPPSLINNWFTRMEVGFLFGIIKVSVQSDISEVKDVIYSVASKLCYILRMDKKDELEYLFNNIIFNRQWFTAETFINLISLTEEDTPFTMKDIKECYSEVINVNPIESTGNIILKKWQEPILPRDWLYLPILLLYSNHQKVETSFVSGNHVEKIAKEQTAKKELIISCSLQWILFNEVSYPDLLNDIDVTDRFCRIMCVFLCDNSLFLDKKVNFLLRKCINVLYKNCNNFNFNKKLTGLSSFQDFYTQFLEQFQSVSYGDYTFASCVLVPLAQRHNVTWRKILWSEYAGCLRALDCPEQYLCYDINEYMYPEETDESLLKSYFRAISSNLLRPGTIAYKIAWHHVECFKKRQQDL